ncbi:MAG: NusG domain II-containing protein [Eubacterium sp.]
MKKSVIKKWDIVLIAAAVLLAAVLFLCISFFSKNGAYINVKVNGFTVAELPLDADMVYEIETDNRITNILEISDGRVSMISADCPDEICVHHKSISKNNETIVCLPNQVLITVHAEQENEVDGVAE